MTMWVDALILFIGFVGAVEATIVAEQDKSTGWAVFAGLMWLMTLCMMVVCVHDLLTA